LRNAGSVRERYEFRIAGFPTTAGSLSLKDSMPPHDAYQVRKLRKAGALVLASVSHRCIMPVNPSGCGGQV
jgi:Amidase